MEEMSGVVSVELDAMVETFHVGDAKSGGLRRPRVLIRIACPGEQARVAQSPCANCCSDGCEEASAGAGLLGMHQA